MHTLRIVVAVVLLLAGAEHIVAQEFEAKTQAQNLLFIADAFNQAGNTEKALQFYAEAEKVATTVSDKWRVATSRARVYVEAHEYHKALEIYNLLLTDSAILADNPTKLKIYLELGRVYFSLGDYVKSIRSFEDSHKIMDSTHDYEMLPSLYSSMAQTLLVAGDIRRAGELIDSAELRCSEGEAMRTQLADIYLIKAEYLAALERYKEAYSYRTQYAKIMTVLGRQRLSEAINSPNPVSIQHRFENEERYKKESENLRRQTEERIEALIVANDVYHVSLVIMGVLAVALLAASVLLFLALRKRKAKINDLQKDLEERQRILSIIAHDFVTPFNALIGFSELQMQYTSALNDKELVEYSRQIYRSAQTLFGFFSNVLIWTKSGRQLEARKERVNVGLVIENVVDICRLMAEDKGIKMSVSVDEQLEVNADKHHLVIMLRNVVTNALKFTKQGGHITISAYIFREKLMITVEDTGIGMSQEVIDAVLNNGSVQSTAGTTGEMGVGLGLGVCRDMMKANGGTLEISSSTGIGTTVTFVFDM